MNDNEQPQPSQEALQGELLAQTERANRIEGQLKSHLLESTLERAAIRGKAFSASQVAGLLKERTEVVPIADQDGSPIEGQYEIIVRAENGEALSVREAVEALRDTDPNMFLAPSDLKGDDKGRDGESPLQMMARLAKTNPAEYHRLRKEKPELLGLRRRRR
jgi:hypothetical protein